MIIYRLAAEAFKNDLSGAGAKLYGGRWNSPGTAVLYTTQNISLAVLEILVRADTDLVPLNYHLIKLELPDTLQPQIITTAKLKKDWKDDPGYTQWMGDEFIKSNNLLFLKVPSAIVDEENNFILNTGHNDFKKIKISSVKKFQFDKRLLLKDE